VLSFARLLSADSSYLGTSNRTRFWLQMDIGWLLDDTRIGFWTDFSGLEESNG
jgi:hypothetical protein